MITEKQFWAEAYIAMLNSLKWEMNVLEEKGFKAMSPEKITELSIKTAKETADKALEDFQNLKIYED